MWKEADITGSAVKKDGRKRGRERRREEERQAKKPEKKHRICELTPDQNIYFLHS